MNTIAPLVNDIHSGLNPTHVRELFQPESTEEISGLVERSHREETPIAISGSRHAMGGQQFASDGFLFDLRNVNRVLDFDEDRGLIRVEAGIQWPELVASYLEKSSRWGIAQKQTGADTLTLGGSLSANVHGRGLVMKPIVENVEELVLMGADGSLRTCSRNENPLLFSLAIGGYGLFGIITEITLRLSPRKKLERVVRILGADELPDAFQGRIEDGYLYGDFQFSIDEKSGDFLQRGVFSCYRPTERPLPTGPNLKLEDESWLELLRLAHSDRTSAFQKYEDYYLRTSGQVYWSDTHQMGPYIQDYASRIAWMSGDGFPTSLVISELYVPRHRLADFLREAARELRERRIVVIYGTVRLIEKDDETFLAWAREPWACIIFNLLVEHSEQGRTRAADAFRILIELAASFGGTYYLTYHRHASFSQVSRCHPRIEDFLRYKREFDPAGIFQSDWYRHYSPMLPEMNQPSTQTASADTSAS